MAVTVVLTMMLAAVEAVVVVVEAGVGWGGYGGEEDTLTHGKKKILRKGDDE